MQKLTQTGLRWLWIAIIIIGLDQITKYYLGHYLVMGTPLQILPFFSLSLAHNTGAAFSFLQNAGGWQLWFFASIAAAISIGIIIYLSRIHYTRVWHSIALMFVMGGALGNLIDRIAHGYVIDFLFFYYQQWSWPAFNVADSFICVGAVMLILELLKSKPS